MSCFFCYWEFGGLWILKFGELEIWDLGGFEQMTWLNLNAFCTYTQSIFLSTSNIFDNLPARADIFEVC